MLRFLAPSRLGVFAAIILAATWIPLHASVVDAAPALPTGQLHFGLSSEPGSLGWMTASGVPWRYRYTYLAGGVGTGSGWETWQDPALPPGQYALDYMTSSGANGFIPVFSYYMLLQSHRAADEATDDYNNLNNSALMSLYYADFTVLMHKAAQYGGQVVVQVEPDLWGYLQQRSNNSTADTVGAAVASSGNADLAGLPNTVQGFGDGLLRLRDRYAPNALLAIHASMWSSMRDIATDTDPTLSAPAEADKTAAFLNSAGIAANPYGSTWDLVFDDVDDHDAGWWEAVQHTTEHWWDPSNVQLPNFARYLAWVGELHARTARPQVVWQVPVGNQYFLTMNNTCGHYQDNVAAYFLAHPSDLYAAGLIAVLFGAGNSCQTTNEDSQGDGVTNNGGQPTTDAAGWCSACNTHQSTVADDDGGFLRLMVGSYYAPKTVPGAPGGVTATAAAQSALVRWQAPSSGGTAITSYVVTVSPGGATLSAAPAGLSVLVPGLSNGVSYTFTVHAVNAVGAGPDSAPSAAVVPSAAQYLGYFSWYDRASPGMLNDNLHVVNPGGSRVTGSAILPGLAPVDFTVEPGAQTYLAFPQGAIGGPLAVVASASVIVEQRVQYYGSFNELAAAGVAQAATDLWFPWYDLASPGMLADNVHIVNPTANMVTGTVTVGTPAVATRTFSVPPGGYTYLNLPSAIGGPLRVQASAPVLASQRVQYYQTFNETAGRPAAVAAPSIYFNWFDTASPGMLNDNLHFVNPGSTDVHARLGLGNPQVAAATVTVPAHGAAYTRFAGAQIGGPITVSADGPLLASQRVQYFGSFNEVAGRQPADAAPALYLPWYDEASPGMLADNVHILNPGGSAVAVVVSVGQPATASRPVTVPAGGEAYISFPGVIGGPLSVTVSGGGAVLASNRVQCYQTFNETALQG